jgi:hypothetical protein
MNVADLLAQKYGDLFEITKATIDKGPTFLAGQNANSMKKQVTLFHLVRAGYLLEATYTLCSQGLATEAMLVLRSLLNLYINLKWLTSADVEQRFQRYADFEVVFKKLAMQAAIDYGGIWDEIKDEDLTVHDHDFDFIKKKYGLTKKKDLFNWSGKSIFSMASEKGVDLEKDYRIIYGQLSSIEHTGPESVRRYLDDSEKGTTLIKAGRRDESINLVLITALEYYFHVKAIAHTIFDVEWIALEKDREAFLKVRSTYWGEGIV